MGIRSLRGVLVGFACLSIAGCAVVGADDVPAGADPGSSGAVGAPGTPGGPPAPGAPQSGCTGAKDCNSGICKAGTCTAPLPDDAVKNDDESDVDCGGAKAPKCGTAKHCNGATDCESAVCTAGACVAASPTDGVLNGGESDIDCGGPNAPKCSVGQACVEHADCASDGCGYDKKCALARSCTAHLGGDTCGPGELDEAGRKHESCCKSIAIGGGKRMDKYMITTGRMRAFVERFNGDIRGFVSKLPKSNTNWDPAWTPNTPSNMDELNVELGPYGVNPDRQGCWMKGAGSRTYWMSNDTITAFDDEIPQKYGKDVLDTKALNCVTFYMLQAFCVWDGLRLPTIDELDGEWGGSFPWGNEASDADHAVLNFGYGWPEDRLDNTAYVAAPGRKPLGNSPKGIADLGGLLFNMTTTFDGGGKVRWSRNGSWEVHKLPYDVHYSPKERGYEAAGGRCVRN